MLPTRWAGCPLTDLRRRARARGASPVISGWNEVASRRPAGPRRSYLGRPGRPRTVASTSTPGADLLDPRRPDEDGVHRLAVPAPAIRRSQVRLERVDLPAEGVAAHGHVDPAERLLVGPAVQRSGRRAGSSRRRSRTPAGPSREPLAQRLAQLEGADQLVHRGRLPAGDDERRRGRRARAGRRTGRASAPQAAERAQVLADVALQGEDADDGRAGSRPPRRTAGARVADVSDELRDAPAQPGRRARRRLAGRRRPGPVRPARRRRLPRRQLPGRAAVGACRGRRPTSSRRQWGTTSSRSLERRTTGGAPSRASATRSAGWSAPRPARSLVGDSTSVNLFKCYVAGAADAARAPRRASPTRARSRPTSTCSRGGRALTGWRSCWRHRPRRAGPSSPSVGHEVALVVLLAGRLPHRRAVGPAGHHAAPPTTSVRSRSGTSATRRASSTVGLDAARRRPRRRLRLQVPQRRARVRRPSSTSRTRHQDDVRPAADRLERARPPVRDGARLSPRRTASPGPGSAPPRCCRCSRWRPR